MSPVRLAAIDDAAACRQKHRAERTLSRVTLSTGHVIDADQRVQRGPLMGAERNLRSRGRGIFVRVLHIRMSK
jgi:hypothetical protein